MPPVGSVQYLAPGPIGMDPRRVSVSSSQGSRHEDLGDGNLLNLFGLSCCVAYLPFYVLCGYAVIHERSWTKRDLSEVFGRKAGAWSAIVVYGTIIIGTLLYNSNVIGGEGFWTAFLWTFAFWAAITMYYTFYWCLGKRGARSNDEASTAGSLCCGPCLCCFEVCCCCC